jgi:hypothetical protein
MSCVCSSVFSRNTSVLFSACGVGAFFFVYALRSDLVRIVLGVVSSVYCESRVRVLRSESALESARGCCVSGEPEFIQRVS